MTADGPVQKIHRDIPLSIAHFNSEKKDVLNVIEEFRQPFDLSRPPLFRIALIETGEAKHMLVIDIHHIIADGSTMSILVRELSALYEGKELPPLVLQYKDYAEWQNRLFESGEMAEQEAYWLDQLSGEIPVLNLPTDFERPPVMNFNGDSIRVDLNEELCREISTVISDRETTTFIFLLTVCYILLFKYTDQEDILVGGAVSGRNNVDLQNIVGMFVNILPMRNRPTKSKTVSLFLEEIKENAIGAFENQDYQFDDLVKKLGLYGVTDRNPIVDVVFQVQNTTDVEKIEGGGTGRTGTLNVSQYELKAKESHFDLLLEAFESKEKINMYLTYSDSLFKRETAERMLTHYIEILEQVTADQNIKLSDITISHDLLELKPAVLGQKEEEFSF